MFLTRTMDLDPECVSAINAWAARSPLFTRIRSVDDGFALDWVPGETLDHELEHGTLSGLDLARVLVLIGDAVTHLHRQHYEHGDLHPANIIIQRFDRPRAVAWLTEPGRVLVTHIVPTLIDYETFCRIKPHQDNYDFVYLFSFLARRSESEWISQLYEFMFTRKRTCDVDAIFERIKARVSAL